MKKVLIAAAAAGLMSLAACTPPAANNTTEATVNDIANAEIYDLGNEVDNGVVENATDDTADLNVTNAM